MGSGSEFSESRSPLSNRGTEGKTTTLRVHRTFLYLSLPFLHNYDVKLPNFTFMEDRVNKRRRNFIPFLNLNMFLKNSTSAAFVYIWQSKWAGIIAIKTKCTQIRFWSDVFAAVASSDRKVPYDGVAQGSFRKTCPNVNWRLIHFHKEIILIYWLCRWTVIKEKHDDDATTAEYFVFLQESLASVDQSKHAIYKSAISKQKQKIALRQGWEKAFKQTTLE